MRYKARIKKIELAARLSKLVRGPLVYFFPSLKAYKEARPAVHEGAAVFIMPRPGQPEGKAQK